MQQNTNIQKGVTASHRVLELLATRHSRLQPLNRLRVGAARKRLGSHLYGAREHKKSK